MKLLNLRYQEYKLALLYFRASALVANNRQWNEVDRDILMRRLFDYCYFRYMSFDISISVSVRNRYSLKSLQAKEYIISYMEKNLPSAVHKYCNKIFGVNNWSHVLPSDYYE